MGSKVLLFCVLFFSSKFVGSTPFGEDLGRQRAYQQNNWQRNVNTAGQYPGTDFARTQNLNSMTNSAQQYTNGQFNQGRPYNNNYDFNNHPSSLQPLPTRNNSENFGTATNERRSDGFQTGGDNYSIKNQNQPIRTDNQYGQQNWQSQNRFVNSAASVISNAATVNERPMKLAPEPYHNAGQNLQLPQTNHHQRYQGDSLYPGNREIHYHPLVEKPGVVKYSAPNSGSHLGNVHYENFNGPRAHNVNIVKPGSNVYPGNSPPYSGPRNPQVSEDYNRSSGLNTDILNIAGNSFNNGPIIPINTGYNNANNEKVDPIISPGPSSYNDGPIRNGHIAKPGNNALLGISPTYSGRPNDVYNRPLGVNIENLNNAENLNDGPIIPSNTRYDNGNNENVDKPIIPSRSNNYPLNNYAAPSVPSYPVLNANRPRYFNNPVINSESEDQPLNNYRYKANPVINPGPSNNAPVNTFDNEDSVLTDTDNDEVHPKPTNDNEEPFVPNETPVDNDKAPEETYHESTYESEPSDSYSPGNQDNSNVYHVSEGENVLNKIHKNFLMVHPDGTVEHVYLEVEDNPKYVVVKKNDKQPPLSQSTKKSGRNGVQHNPNILETLSNKTDYSFSPMNQNDYKNNMSPNENDDDSSVPRSQKTEATTSPPWLQSTTTSYNNQHYNQPHHNGGPHNSYYPHQPYWDPVLPSKLHTSITSTSTTAPSPDDELTEFIDSLSHKHEDKNRPPEDDQDDSSSQTDRPSNDHYPHEHRRSTTPSYRSTTPEGNNYHPYNDHRHPHPSYRNHSYPQSPPKSHTSTTTTTTTPSPDDELTEFIESLSHKQDDKNRPSKDDQDDSSSQTDRPSNDYYPHDHRRSTTPSSRSTNSEEDNYHLNNNRHYPHPSYWNHKHPQLSPKAQASTNTTTPSPGDELIMKFIESLSHKHNEKNRPTKDDQDDSSFQTDRPSDDYYPHDHRRSTTSSSRSSNPEGNNYSYNSKWHKKHRPKGQHTSTTSSPDDDNDDDDDVKKGNGNYDSSTGPRSAHNDYPSELIPKISPGLYRSTTSSPEGNKHSLHKSNLDSKSVPYNSRINHFSKDLPDKLDKTDSSEIIPNSHSIKDDNDYPDVSNSDVFNHFLDDIPDKPRKTDDTSSKLIPSDNDQIDQILPVISTHKDDRTQKKKKADSRDHSSFDPISPTDSIPVDEIITISPIELATDNVKDDSTPSQLDEGIFDNDYLDAIKYQSDSDEVKTPYYSSTSIIDQNDDNTDNDFIPITEGNNSDETVIITKDIVKNDIKSACNDSFTNIDVPAKSDDNTAAVINQNDVNTDDSSTGDNLLESEQTSGLTLTLNMPNDFDDTLYIYIDVPDSYTGNEDRSNDDTVYVQIKRQNNSDTDSTAANKDQISETTLNKDTMIDLSNALVVMNGTTDKDYLNQLLSGESKVNMFIFQMPCQEQVLVEKSKHTTLFCNGTCLIETTETTWKNKDDPTPSVISTKIFTKGDKCQ